ncbi:hypothetical protein IWQ61_000958 [Dispira simplex]|nr:hypothetical protein IWQ61_000958 [Dispira simplex]
MSDAVAPPARSDNSGSPSERDPNQDSPVITVIKTVSRFMLMYFVIQYITSYFMPSIVPQQSSPTSDHKSATGTSLSEGSNIPPSHITPQVTPLWPTGTQFSLRVYLSEDQAFDIENSELPIPIWQHNELKVGDWDIDLTHTVDISIPERVQHNSSMYAHMVLHRTTHPSLGEPLRDSTSDYVQISHPLNKYVYKAQETKRRRLLQADNEYDPKQALPNDGEEPATTYISHWCGNLTYNLMTESSSLPYQKLPSLIRDHITLEKTGLLDPVTHQRYYQPLVYVNTFWTLSSDLVPINSTTPVLPLILRFYPISFFKLQMYLSFEEQTKKQMQLLGSGGGGLDEFKRMLTETNPWLLALTAIITLLHSVFDLLAFKNDIAFWKVKKDTTGISVRAILSNIVFQVIIFLYLLDNRQGTSWMILFSQGAGLVIEVWKVKKAVDIQVVSQSAISTTEREVVMANQSRLTAFTLLGHQITVRDKAKLSAEELKTQEYDRMAFRYLSYVAYPLLAGYTLYSMYYEEHKSWYSFVINTLVGYVYAFGFITMTPQLFINYKLKSVAHMPWRTFMYKALNTFVDDLFAFIIKMPTLHRLACLRDDVVFLVYLYQRWIYPMDSNRPNEFGQVAQEPGPSSVSPAMADKNSSPVVLGESSDTKKDQ